VGTILELRIIRRAIYSIARRPFSKMNISKKGITTTVVALTIVLIVVIVAAAAYIAVSPGKTSTVTKTTTSTSISTSITTSVTTATSTPPTYYPMTLQAYGGTFVNPLMQTWAKGFQEYTGNQVLLNYQAIGTGAAQTDILANTGAFDGGDAPISAAQIAAAAEPTSLGNLLQFPEALGGVAIFYNLPGVTAHLNFTGPIVADIYVGKITMWNDPAIQALNPKITLPAQTITPVHRSDGSGTTYALSNYFEKVSADWNATFTGGCPCYGTSIPSTTWGANPNNVGAKGSPGVTAYVLGNAYSIGYADSVYAIDAGLLSASIENQAGVFLTPTVADITAAAAAFSAQVQANPTFTITNAPGAGSYPISTYTYLYVWENQANYQQGYDVAQLFEWIVSVSQGQTFSSGLNYAPLPAAVVTIDQGIISQMSYNGVPFIPT
jgi:phosphate transport system substrate-binding protein